ncbi:MAG: hypothetical protein JNL57_02140 [Bacteroidetes bacterium]|nr:hypothetical protein [Bacteroidota bacterium]
MKTFILTILFTCLFPLAYSQGLSKVITEPEISHTLKYDRGFSSEMNYQGKWGFALGGILGKNLGHKTKTNYSCGFYTDLVLADSLIFGPRFKLNWNHHNGFGISMNFQNYYRSGLNEYRITPEVNFSLSGVANLFVGSSFILGKTQFTQLSKYRIGVNINILAGK